MTIAAGERLGPYELIAPIGAGGMGSVWRALDTRLEREVAIKFLAAALAGDADAARRFEREARAAAALSHPSILSLFDVGTHDGSPFLVTELLRGETLRERLGRGPLAAEAVAALGREVANALAAAHAAGIVHRDIKPENLFLAADGRVKLLDFGLASLAESGPAGSRLTALTGTGMVMGTVGYLAPEQLRAEKVGPAADLFALGCVLFECCCGASPFRRPSIAATLHAIANESAPDLGESTGVPASIATWISRCLDKDPARRPSAAELARELGGNLATAPTEFLRAVPAVRSARRPGVVIAAIGGAAALAVALLVLATRDRAPAGSPEGTGAPAVAAKTPAPGGGEARGTADEEAWKLYVRGRHAWEKRGPSLLEARDLFKEAVDRDPSFAKGWLGLADTYAVLHDYAAMSTSETFPKSKAAAERALELDPALAGAHIDLAYVAFYFDREVEVAEREFKAAIALAPGEAKSHQWYSELLTSEGRFDEALAEVREAQRLEPLAPMMFAEEVWELSYAGHHDEAIERGERAALEFTDFGPLFAYRALALLAGGRVEEGLALLEEPRFQGVSPVHSLWLAYARALAGRTADAESALAAALEKHGDAYLNAYYRAYSLAQLGRTDEALASLATAIDRREEQIVWMKRDPHLASLRTRPEMAGLLGRAGFRP